MPAEATSALLSAEQVAALVQQALELAKFVGPATTTLLAGYLGYRFALRRARHQKQLDFIERQVTHFYSPIVGCLKRIRAESNLRLELSGAADAAWRDICDRAPKPFVDHSQQFEPFKRLIEYENTKFSDELLPLYDRMVAIFTDNYWLAESSTQQHYSELCRFVEMWHRFLNRSLPREILDHIEHREERLHPFYADLETQLARLRGVLAGGRPTSR
ncbi:hypothetical protein PLCT1_00209 [Planctomycetaceae bacterium]|nr:hypothetical protein PLCT1_00209 [Planctomycetaceae bacterium]